MTPRSSAPWLSAALLLLAPAACDCGEATESGAMAEWGALRAQREDPETRSSRTGQPDGVGLGLVAPERVEPVEARARMAVVREAEAALRSGRLPDRSGLDDLLESDPSSPRVLRLAAMADRAGGRLDEARARSRRAVTYAVTPAARADALVVHADVLRELGDEVDAARALLEAARLSGRAAVDELDARAPGLDGDAVDGWLGVRLVGDGLSRAVAAPAQRCTEGDGGTPECSAEIVLAEGVAVVRHSIGNARCVEPLFRVSGGWVGIDVDACDEQQHGRQRAAVVEASWIVPRVVRIEVKETVLSHDLCDAGAHERTTIYLCGESPAGPICHGEIVARDHYRWRPGGGSAGDALPEGCPVADEQERTWSLSIHTAGDRTTLTGDPEVYPAALLGSHPTDELPCLLTLRPDGVVCPEPAP